MTVMFLIGCWIFGSVVLCLALMRASARGGRLADQEGSQPVFQETESTTCRPKALRSHGFHPAPAGSGIAA